jgi:hypothetical protein
MARCSTPERAALKQLPASSDRNQAPKKKAGLAQEKHTERSSSMSTDSEVSDPALFVALAADNALRKEKKRHKLPSNELPGDPCASKSGSNVQSDQTATSLAETRRCGPALVLDLTKDSDDKSVPQSSTSSLKVDVIEAARENRWDEFISLAYKLQSPMATESNNEALKSAFSRLSFLFMLIGNEEEHSRLRAHNRKIFPKHKKKQKDSQNDKSKCKVLKVTVGRAGHALGCDDLLSLAGRRPEKDPKANYLHSDVMHCLLE